MAKLPFSFLFSQFFSLEKAMTCGLDYMNFKENLIFTLEESWRVCFLNTYLERCIS